MNTFLNCSKLRQEQGTIQKVQAREAKKTRAPSAL